MKKFFKLLPFYITTFMLSVYAHSGGTDSSGGHYNRKTGKYHYHHGYSAHQHSSGNCPYELTDFGEILSKAFFILIGILGVFPVYMLITGIISSVIDSLKSKFCKKDTSINTEDDFKSSKLSGCISISVYLGLYVLWVIFVINM